MPLPLHRLSFRKMNAVLDVAHKNRGFGSMVKPNSGGVRFTQLIDRVSQINPEIRIRFTSPHPKDFPDDVRFLTRSINTSHSNSLITVTPSDCGTAQPLQRCAYARSERQLECAPEDEEVLHTRGLPGAHSADTRSHSQYTIPRYALVLWLKKTRRCWDIK